MPTRTSSRAPARLALLTLFFFSGACGLTYQVLWLRQLSLVFGVTVYAASTVLAAFMTGLGLGSVAAGRVLARTDRPLVAFGIAEILVGISAVASPVLLDSASLVYAALSGVAPESLGLLTLARFLCSFVVLLIPTALMGLTLPLLSASTLVRGSSFGSRVGTLYATNTAGAVAGVLVTGFHLIGTIGMQRTFFLAGALNVAIGVLAWLLSRRVDERRADDVAEPFSIEPRAIPITLSWQRQAQAAVLILIVISGLASLALEIVWFRILVQFLPATTYAFTTMLATVLAGIAVGGAAASRLLARPRDLLGWLAAVQMATGVAALSSSSFLAWSYQAGWRTSGAIQASVAAILPAALLMGLSFPVALRLGAVRAAGDLHDRTAVGRRVGRLYALNVLGAIAGSLAGGFVLLPLLGTRLALVALSGVYVASGLMLAAVHPRRGRSALIGMAGLALFAMTAPRTPDPFAAAFARRHGSNMRELWRDDGAQTAVSVHGSRLRHSLFLDGLHQANDTGEMVRLHRIIGHLPMALHPAPADALVIGLGGGATPGAVSQHGSTRVQVVELSDGVRRAARFFAHVNYDVLNQPNVLLRLDDGRNFLMLTDQRFDVVTADLIQPIHAGAGNLYSREYFALVRRALRPGGLVLQWIGHRPETQYKLIMRTFADVFPGTTLWFDGNLMVGSVEPLRLSREDFEAKLHDPRTREALAAVGRPGLLLTDDRPLVEYHRSLPANDPPANLSKLRGDVKRLLDPRSEGDSAR
ncbi:MAG: fused MFS/spermidine synthase [Acidobacteria bacterium]|nr:fused MFS/spermidine synthase [Acidobacteriota bacterium]